ncbi:MAG: NAD-dependent deacetylase [Paraglaciecola sp.]|jgi:NAD-dependent deacetylase
MEQTKKKIVVLTGAGISAESGISTFRDADGLWEGFDVREVASPDGWHKNRELVLKFYNDRRRQLKSVKPNIAHHALVDLEKDFEVVVITQNVDDLHERAGSSQIIHLHGELKKVRSTLDERLVYDWEEDCNIGDRCEKNAQLRPHIVWFGEMVPMLEVAQAAIMMADIVIIVGTSMQVYPAAGLVSYAPKGTKVYFVDPNPTINHELDLQDNLEIIGEKGSVGVPLVVERILA